MKRLIVLLSFTLASLSFAQPRTGRVTPVPPVAPVAPVPPPLPPRFAGLGYGTPGIPASVAQKLGIAADVVKKVRDLSFDANEQLIQLEADLKKGQLELERALSATAPDEAAVMAKLEGVNRAELQVRKNRMGLLLRIRNTVGPVLWEKLQGELSVTTIDEGPMLSGGGMRREVVRVIRRGNADGEVQTEDIQGP